MGAAAVGGSWKARFVDGKTVGGGYWGLEVAEEDTCEGLDMVLDVCKWVCVGGLSDASEYSL